MIDLLSMVHKTVQIMKKIPNTTDIKSLHKFYINPYYTNSKNKILIPRLNIKLY